MKEGVYYVAFRKKDGQNLISKNQILRSKCELDANKNHLLSKLLILLGAMCSAILKQWELRFLFRASMKQRKRKFLGQFHPQKL